MQREILIYPLTGDHANAVAILDPMIHPTSFRKIIKRVNFNGIILGDPDTKDWIGFILHQIVDEGRMLNILDMAVAPSWRRLGMGRFLVNKSIQAQQVIAASAFVPESNLDAQLFFARGFKKRRFVCTEIVPRSFVNDAEDCYRFVWRTPSHADIPQNRIARYLPPKSAR